MKFRTYFPPGVIRYDPKEIYDGLPAETRERVSPGDLTEVLVVLEAFHATYAELDRLKDSKRYIRELAEFVSEESA